MNITNNLLTFTYQSTGIVAFAVRREYGKVTNKDLKEFVTFFFKRLFPDFDLETKIVSIGASSFTSVEVNTPDGIRLLDWSWQTVLEETE